LCVDQPPAYVLLLEMNEEVAGEIKIAEYKEKNPGKEAKANSNSNANANGNGEDDTNGTTSSPFPESPLTQKKTMSTWKGFLQFEGLHTLPSAYTVFLICVVHSAFYGVLECLSRTIYQLVLKRWVLESLFYNSMIFLGLFLLRFNGGLFFYSRTNRDYNRIKMEMSNRLRLGMFDARFFRRIKGSITASSFNLFGYYLICIGINHFYYKYQDRWMSQHSAWFEDSWDRAVNLVNAEALQQQEQWEANFSTLATIVSSPTFEEVTPSCEVAADMVSHSILKPFYRFWCLSTSSDYECVELAFHGLCLLLSAGLAFHVGQNLMTFCD